MVTDYPFHVIGGCSPKDGYLFTKYIFNSPNGGIIIDIYSGSQCVDHIDQWIFGFHGFSHFQCFFIRIMSNDTIRAFYGKFVAGYRHKRNIFHRFTDALATHDPAALRSNDLCVGSHFMGLLDHVIEIMSDGRV